MIECPRVEDVRLLWAFDFWDGPLSGVARSHGRHYWFQVEEPDWAVVDDWPAVRLYFLYPLTDLESADERKEHRRFEEHVRKHADYPYEVMFKPGSDFLKFWDEQRERPDPEYTSRPPVGYFTLGPGDWPELPGEVPPPRRCAGCGREADGTAQGWKSSLGGEANEGRKFEVLQANVAGPRCAGTAGYAVRST
jgi:hypothetical protein